MSKHARPHFVSWILKLTLLLIILIGGGFISLMFWPQDTSVSKNHKPVATLGVSNTSLYHPMRSVDFMGQHFVMLKHEPTSQRVIALLGTAGKGSTYNQLYDNPLSPFQLELMMKLFKPHSHFENRTLKVTAVTPNKTGVLASDADYSIAYRTYDIALTIDGQPQHFEAYVGKIQHHTQTEGLVFTFNLKDNVSLAVYRDLLSNLQTR